MVRFVLSLTFMILASVAVLAGNLPSPRTPATRQYPYRPQQKRKPASLEVSTQLKSHTKSFFIGHNLTPATEIPQKGTWTVGSYAVGYALTDEILVATSPWIYVSYNTNNVHMKYSHMLTPKSDIGFFASYFDSNDSTNLMNANPSSPNVPTGPGGFAVPGGGPGSTSSTTTTTTVSSGMNRYQWHSYSLSGLYSYRWSEATTEYFNLKYSYYFNDEMPYSLRMDPGDDSIRDQWDASTLWRFSADRHVCFDVELGVLGMNYVKPFAHSGLSIGYQGENWMLQLGGSYTLALEELGSSSALQVGRYDQRVHYSESTKQYYTERYLQVAVHPEIQLQYSF